VIWPTARLDELCSRIYSGGTPTSSNSAYYGGDIPWLRTQEVTFNRIKDTEIKITEAGYENSAANWVPERSVIVAMYGNSAGRSAITEIPLTTNQACCNLLIDPALADYRYVFYALVRNYEALKGQSRGAAQNNLNATQVKKFEIPCPPVSVQQRIGDVISSYDDLIENNRRRIHLLEQSARLLYREWFVYLRFPGHEHVRVKDGVPDGWERVPLGEALILQRGFDLPSSARTEGDVPIYASTGITGYHNKAMVTGPGVVTGRSGSLGQVMYVPCDFWPLNTSLWVKEFKRVSTVFAYHLLSGLGLDQYNGGAAVPTLNRNDVHRIEVVIPPTALMNELTEFGESQLAQVNKLTRLSGKAREARDLLLPRLMSGEIAA